MGDKDLACSGMHLRPDQHTTRDSRLLSICWCPGTKELRIVLGEVWLVAVYKHQLSGPSPELRLGNSLTMCGRFQPALS